MNATSSPIFLDPGRAKADLQLSLRNCVLEGIVAMPVVTMSLPVNVYLTAMVTKGWVLSKPAIGLLTAMPYLANFLQIFFVPQLMHRWRMPKQLCLASEFLHLLSWAALVPILSWLPHDNPGLTARWLIGWFLVSSLFSSMSAVTWNTWIDDWVPARIRGKFFGRRNRLLQISVLIFLTASGWVLARGAYSVLAFQIVVIGAVVLRLFSLRWQWKSPTRSYRRHPPPALALRDQFTVLRRAKGLLWFIAFGAAWFFAANCFGPFYQVFLFEQLHLSAFDVGLLSTVSALGGALSLPGWGKLLDRYGNRPVMVVSLLVWQVVNLLWCVITPTSHVIVYLIWALGGMTSMGAIASAGFVLGQFTILLRLIPAEAKSLAIGLNLAVTSFAAAVAPVIGGYVLGWALHRWPNALDVYHACFLVQPIIAVASCALLLKVHEAQASSLTMVFGAMRNIRTLSGVLGLDFLVNYVFYRSPKRTP